MKVIRELAAICKEHRFDEKLLFVPSYAIGHQIGESLARAGHAWINLRPTTVSGYAQGLVGVDLARGGFRLIDSRERLLIVEGIFRSDETLDGPGSYFAGSSGIPGILKCLAGSIHELRMEGFTPENLDSSCFIVPKKGEALRRLLTGYEKFLTENRLVDQAGMITLACRLLKEGKIRTSSKIVLMLSDFALSGVEKKFVGLAAGDNLVVIGYEPVRGLRYPKRFSGAPAAVTSKPKAVRSDIELLPFLFTPEEAPPPVKDNSVSLFHALGESNEVREVLRRVVASGIPLDDVEILFTRTEPYTPLIYEITQSLGIPATFASGIPIRYTRPGKALLLYLLWVAEDLSGKYVRKLFSGGYLKLASDNDGERPSSGKAASIIREAGIGWGKERYLNRLKALEEGYLSKAEEWREEGEEERAVRAESQAQRVAWVNRFIGGLIATVPQGGSEGDVSLGAVSKGAVEFLRKFSRTASDLDGTARNKLIDTMEAYASAPALQLPLKEAAERVAKVVDSIAVGNPNPEPGHIHVASFRSGGYSGRSNTFILGLDQASFPGPQLQDPIILDRERMAMGDRLVLSQGLFEENLYTMARALCSLRGHVTLSCSCRDLLEDRELFPSSLLLGAFRLVAGNSSGDYSDLQEFLGQPSGFVPMAGTSSLNDWEWWFAQGNPGGDHIFKSYPMLLSGVKAEEERKRERLSEYDGLIGIQGGDLDPLKSGTALSCSRLESLAKCPFSFFVQYVLGIEPLEELEKDLGQWLYPLQKGDLLHTVLCRFMEGFKGGAGVPKFAEHISRLEAIAIEEVERWKAEVPPPGEAAFKREMRAIRKSLEIFLMDEEERYSSSVPIFLELSFGTGKEKRCGEAIEEHVEILLPGGKSFKLRGRIDRVDRCGTHEYEVWDYKTGSTYGYKEGGYLNRGRHLQHALYAIAAEDILRKKVDKNARVLRAGYYFPSPKGEGKRILKDQQNLGEVHALLEDLFKLLRRGVFAPSCDADYCGKCKYTNICGGKEVAVKRSKGKLEADEQMAPVGRLRKHA